MTFLEILNEFSKNVAAKYGPELGKGLLAMRVSEELFMAIETESAPLSTWSDGKVHSADTLEVFLASGFFSIQKKVPAHIERRPDC